jgi:mono/diheme cytochrome c family protein
MNIRNGKTHAMVLFFLCLALLLGACSSKGAAAVTPDPNAPKPSNPGGTGEAVNLTGDKAAGETVFKANCVTCHGDEGKVGIANPGSTDGTVPSLNPIDPGLVNTDPKVFAANLDLYLQNGSTPEAAAGATPAQVMKAFGSSGALTQQQIADVIAYVMSLNGH